MTCPQIPAMALMLMNLSACTAWDAKSSPHADSGDTDLSGSAGDTARDSPTNSDSEDSTQIDHTGDSGLPSDTADTGSADTHEPVEIDLESQAQGELVGTEPGLGGWWSLPVGAGDFDGDGRSDVIVGMSEQGSVFLFRGPVIGATPMSSASGVLTAGGDQVGVSVASAGDLDGDGSDDILVGAPGYGPTYDGEVFVVLGPVSGNGRGSAHLDVGDQNLRLFA